MGVEPIPAGMCKQVQMMPWVLHCSPRHTAQGWEREVLTLTHPSYGDNRLTVSYEKLEFLEDAVLDYLVTCYIYTNTELEADFAEFC
jgi:dsRNA-specific ribonuclease